MTRLARQLARVLMDLGIIPADDTRELTIHRTHAKHDGAFSWWVWGPDHKVLATSGDSVAEVIAAHREGLVVVDIPNWHPCHEPVLMVEHKKPQGGADGSVA